MHCSSSHFLASSVSLFNSLFSFLHFPYSTSLLLYLCFSISISCPFSLSLFFVSYIQCILHHFPSLNSSTDSIFQFVLGKFPSLLLFFTFSFTLDAYVVHCPPFNFSVFHVFLNLFFFTVFSHISFTIRTR